MENFKTAPNEAEKMIRKFVENRMEEKGITRYRLQNLTGLNRTTIARWLDGKTSITVGNLLKVLEALEVRPYLIPAEDDDTEMMRMFFN